MSKRLKNSRYITGFDGIRTLAVVGVIFYHLLPGSIKGGFLGVPIFFVVSGYLITDLMLQEWDQNGYIGIKDFYTRRIHRLYPALVAMIFITTAYITLFQRALLQHIRDVIITNLTYVYNWYEIIHHQSYFDKFGTPSPFTHLWSLSIEGQFYLIWPVVVVLLMKFVKNKTRIFWGLIVLAMSSAMLMAGLYHPGQDPSRVYYGTDTRMFSILLGAGLAFIWPSSKLKKNLDKGFRWFLDGVGIAALIGILYMFATVNGEGTFVYRGGMLILSILSMIFVATVAHPGADMNRLMTNKVFDWIGKRSYGIYIYQYPVMVFYEATVKNIGNHPWLNALIEIAIILVISNLSYRFIERPLRRTEFKKVAIKIRDSFKRGTRNWKVQLGVLAATMIFGVATYGAIAEPKQQTSAQADGQQLEKKIAKNEDEVKKHNEELKNQKMSSVASSAASSQSKQAYFDKNGKLTPAGQKAAQSMQITAVGDSVMADAASTLQKEFPKMYINAKVGRQASAAPDILQTLKNQNQLAPNVLLSLGTNGTIEQSDLDKIMSIIGKDRNVYWLNVHVPTRSWQNEVNSTLNNAKKKYPNLHVLDWYDYSNGKTDWFYADNVHPNENGLKYYGDFVLHGILGQGN